MDATKPHRLIDTSPSNKLYDTPSPPTFAAWCSRNATKVIVCQLFDSYGHYVHSPLPMRLDREIRYDQLRTCPHLTSRAPMQDTRSGPVPKRVGVLGRCHANPTAVRFSRGPMIPIRGRRLQLAPRFHVIDPPRNESKACPAAPPTNRKYASGAVSQATGRIIGRFRLMRLI